MKKTNLLCLTALPILLCAPAAAFAEDAPAPPAGPPGSDTPVAVPGGDSREVAFSADQLTYDTEAEIVTASGDVRMNSEGNALRADRIVWTRSSDEIRAEGNVRLVTPEGDGGILSAETLVVDLQAGVNERDRMLSELQTQYQIVHRELTELMDRHGALQFAFDMTPVERLKRAVRRYLGGQR